MCNIWKKLIINDLYNTRWLLYVDLNVRKDVKQILNGSEWDDIERSITKLYSHDVDGDIKNIDCFWSKFKEFQIQTGIYSNIKCCNILDVQKLIFLHMAW